MFGGGVAVAVAERHKLRELSMLHRKHLQYQEKMFVHARDAHTEEVPFRESRVDVDGLSVNYIDEGRKDAKVLLLVHGGGDSSSYNSWRLNIEELSRSYRVIAPDLPGFGKTHKPDKKCTLDYYVNEFMPKFIESLGLSGQKLLLAGSSMGGGIVLGYALDHPEMVEKQILIGSYGLYDRSFSRLANRLAHMPHFSYRAFELMRTRAGKVLDFVVGLSLLDAIKEHDMLVNIKEVREHDIRPAFFDFLDDQITKTGFRTNYSKRVGELSERGIQTMIVHGTEDPLFPIKDILKVADRIKDCKFYEMTGCGHSPQLKDPDSFNAKVLEFLSAEGQEAARAETSRRRRWPLGMKLFRWRWSEA